MKNLKRYTFWMLVLAFVSCKEHTPPDPIGSETPVFSSEGEIDGVAVKLTADGENSIAEAQTFKDSLDTYVHQGMIKNASCQVDLCGPAFLLNVRGNVSLDQSVMAEPYAFRHIDQTPVVTEYYTVRISPEGLGTPEKCTWTIAGTEIETTSGLEQLVLERTSNDPTYIEIDLVAEFAGGCSSEISNHVYLPSHGCDVTIEVDDLGADTYLYKAIATGKTGFDYNWRFESGARASSEEVHYFYENIPADGVETALLQVESETCEATRRWNQVIDEPLAECNINFNYTIETIADTVKPVLTDPDVNTIELTWVDASNTHYFSTYTSQPGWAYFHIESVEDYEDASMPDTETSKKVSVRFSCLMESLDGEQIEVRDMEMTLPVGIDQ